MAENEIDLVPQTAVVASSGFFRKMFMVVDDVGDGAAWRRGARHHPRQQAHRAMQ